MDLFFFQIKLPFVSYPNEEAHMASCWGRPLANSTWETEALCPTAQEAMNPPNTHKSKRELRSFPIKLSDEIIVPIY